MRLIVKGRSVVALLALATVTSQALADKIYWTEFLGAGDPRIKRANLDGSEIELLVIAVGNPLAVALDPAGGKIYWTSSGSPMSIWRANLDGSNEELLLSVNGTPVGVAIHAGQQKLYWVLQRESGDADERGLIQRANLDGTAVESITHLRSREMGRRIALDPNGQKMYVVTSMGIVRMSLDGGDFESVVPFEGPGPPTDLALDLINGKLYWTNEFTKQIRRVNLDGTEPELIITEPGPVTGIDLDVYRGHMYWCHGFTNGTLRKARIDGTQIEDLVVALKDPYAIALDLDCGNGLLDLGETCDVAIPAGSPGACPTVCSDGNPCTSDALVGAGSCQAQCEFTPITDPIDGDGCCPEGATPMTDSDCAAVPTVTGWGVTILALGLLVAAKTRHRRRS